MLEKLKEIIIDNGFTIYGENEPMWELRQYTPAGEDWIVELEVNNDVNTLITSLKEYVDNFDVDEEVAIFIEMRGTHGVPCSIRTLLEDAEWKEEILQNLLKDIEKSIDNLSEQ